MTGWVWSYEDVDPIAFVSKIRRTHEIQRVGIVGVQLEISQLADFALGVALDRKPADPSSFGLVGIHGENVVAAPARMLDVVGASGDRPPVPSVDDVESEGGLDLDHWMQAVGRLPCAVAHTRDVFALSPGVAERDTAPVASDHIAGVGQS